MVINFDLELVDGALILDTQPGHLSLLRKFGRVIVTKKTKVGRIYCPVTLQLLDCTARICSRVILRSSMTLHFLRGSDIKNRWISTQMVIFVGDSFISRIQSLLSLITWISASSMVV